MGDSVETKRCTNCKLDILLDNYLTHSIHCQRNIYLCCLCNQPVNYNQKIEHDEAHHTIAFCTNCNAQMEKCYLEDHTKTECPKRKIKCQICDIEVQAIDIEEHENYCGARTEKCLECGEFVMLKYKTLHVESNHTFIKLSDEPGPSPLWQYGRRTLSNFMPDFTSKNYKPVSSHRRKTSENQKKRFRMQSGEIGNEDNEIDTTSSENNFFHNNSLFTPLSVYLESKNEDSNKEKKNSAAQNEKFYTPKPPGRESIGTESNFKTSQILNETKKSLKRDAEDWSTLSGLRSLQISNDTQNNSEVSQTGNRAGNKIDEESDFLYAVQVDKELNFCNWKQRPGFKTDEELKNTFKIDVEKMKFEGKDLEKNIYTSNCKRKVKPEDKITFSTDDSADITFLNLSKSENKQVRLPCEFCGSLIPSDNLFLHQSGCDFFIGENLSIERARPKRFSLTEVQETEIPCEFCNKLFRFSQLEGHQLTCNPEVMKYWKNQDETCYAKELESKNFKSGCNSKDTAKQSSSLIQINRFSERSPGLATNNSIRHEKESKINLNQSEVDVVSKTTRVSKKTRRAPPPPKM